MCPTFFILGKQTFVHLRFREKEAGCDMLTLHLNNVYPFGSINESVDIWRSSLISLQLSLFSHIKGATYVALLICAQQLLSGNQKISTNFGCHPIIGGDAPGTPIRLFSQSPALLLAQNKRYDLAPDIEILVPSKERQQEILR
jgi:hypothetical protein